MPKLPDGIPQSLADAYNLARSSNSQLAVADARVNKLTAYLAQANIDETAAMVAARDSLKSAGAVLDDYVSGLRANLESFVTAPDDAPPVVVDPPVVVVDPTPAVDPSPVVDPVVPAVDPGVVPADDTVPN